LACCLDHHDASATQLTDRFLESRRRGAEADKESQRDRRKAEQNAYDQRD
jgi:hypothetical protein